MALQGEGREMNEADEEPLRGEPMQHGPMQHEPMQAEPNFGEPGAAAEAAGSDEGAAWLSYAAPVHRIPNAADAMVFLLLLGMGLVAMVGLIGLGLKLHWFGWHDPAKLLTDTRLALGSQLGIYVVALLAAFPIYRTMWGRGLMEGLQWRPRVALGMVKRLVLVAVGCDVMAAVGNALLPFPQHAPIDKMFSTASDAWMLFAFGVTAAPFFEEMIFRGFLVPALATGWEWAMERMTGRAPRRVDAEGFPVWGAGAMIFAAMGASVPFALMHGAQVSHAWGPLSLLYGVSLVLCAVRLRTRSLAASMVVHASYNFLLFAAMLVQSGGFRHLERLQ